MLGATTFCPSTAGAYTLPRLGLNLIDDCSLRMRYERIWGRTMMPIERFPADLSRRGIHNDALI
jgi:hypothetical protein